MCDCFMLSKQLAMQSAQYLTTYTVLVLYCLHTLNIVWTVFGSCTGTGGNPELGEQAAQESLESLSASVGNADMV